MATFAFRERRSIAVVVLVVAAGLGVAAAQAPPMVVKRSTRAGHEVLVRGFAEFDAACKLKRVQTITVVVPPTGGSIETRPGDVVIGPNWVGAGDCQGKTLRGVNVVYVPAPGFTGADRFSLDVGYSAGLVVRAEVEVNVR